MEEFVQHTTVEDQRLSAYRTSTTTAHVGGGSQSGQREDAEVLGGEKEGEEDVGTMRRVPTQCSTEETHGEEEACTKSRAQDRDSEATCGAKARHDIREGEGLPAVPTAVSSEHGQRWLASWCMRVGRRPLA